MASPLAGGGDKHLKIGASIGLTDEFVQHLWAQSAVIVFGQCFGAQGRIWFGGGRHCELSLWSQEFKRSAD